MPATRSSQRLAGQSSSPATSPSSSQTKSNGHKTTPKHKSREDTSEDKANKRKAEASPSADAANKRGRQPETQDGGHSQADSHDQGNSQATKGGAGGDAKQPTLDSVVSDIKNGTEQEDVQMSGALDEAPKDDVNPQNGEYGNEDKKTNGHKTQGERNGGASQDAKANEEKASSNHQNSANGHSKDHQPKDSVAAETDQKPSTSDATIEEDKAQDSKLPSSVMEKGLIYFFFRGRVGIDEPSSVTDIARSYIVLRPLPRDATLHDGAVRDQNAGAAPSSQGQDEGKHRVLALPKKVLPTSPKDRFMLFVEKTHATVDDVRTQVLQSSDYETRTAGTRHTPAAAPVAEGVYALTSTGRESHLAYLLTLPEKLSSVQEDVGLQAQGSFVVSVKNPQYEGPSNAQLPEGPKFPSKILDGFNSLRWTALKPEHLDYVNAQMLFIGHGDGSLDKGTQPQQDDADKIEPKAVLEDLEEADHQRVEHLKGDDAVFADLKLSKNDYPSLRTSW